MNIVWGFICGFTVGLALIMCLQQATLQTYNKALSKFKEAEATFNKASEMYIEAKVIFDRAVAKYEQP